MINKEKIVNYVKKQNKGLSTHKIGNINVFIKDKLINDIDIDTVFSKIDKLLPDHILELVDVVYLGHFDFLTEKSVNATYMDGAIYTSNIQDNEKDLLDDIIHEFSHASEEKYGQFIYDDGNIENEFLLKRSRLKRILSYQKHDIQHLDFSNIEYDSIFDSVMYKTIGYNALRMLAKNLFLAPYSINSLKEYFARGFEEFYLGNKVYLKSMCPYLYNELLNLHEEYIEEF